MVRKRAASLLSQTTGTRPASGRSRRGPFHRGHLPLRSDRGGPTRAQKPCLRGRESERERAGDECPHSGSHPEGSFKRPHRREHVFLLAVPLAAPLPGLSLSCERRFHSQGNRQNRCPPTPPPSAGPVRLRLGVHKSGIPLLWTPGRRSPRRLHRFLWCGKSHGSSPRGFPGLRISPSRKSISAQSFTWPCCSPSFL